MTLKGHYDSRLQRLSALRRKLKVRSPPVGVEPEDARPEAADPPSPSYPTSWGVLSFEDILARTRRYAAYVLHTTYEVAPPDVDDGLQAAYMKLWQRLQQQPDLLSDKSLAWMGKTLAYAALHATRGDWQFRRQTSGYSGNRRSETHGTYSSESRRANIRLDLQAAIAATAEAILATGTGKRQFHDLWALYGLTMLQACATEVSTLFGAREQSIQAAYRRVRQALQQRLPDYAPKDAARIRRGRGSKTLPRQDTTLIRKGNTGVSEVLYQAVKLQIETLHADTCEQDLLALAGIERGIGAQTLARMRGIHPARMQRAYMRVHLMIGAQRDPTVRTRRPEKRVKPVFTLTEATGDAVHQLALELLKQPKSYEKLVALHAHINNFAISTTAKHFNIPTSTLRFYALRIKAQLGTPTKPAREVALPTSSSRSF